ncbi:TIGR01906 family membrane protein [Sporolactobacillus sp. Y61]|uniref:TIGR01906 family membrane protein n=1 Tax=Sporolactobacillus sp. Y61 TaxID=3160863 RepID=A0AAU8IEH6_9BACL
MAKDVSTLPFSAYRIYQLLLSFSLALFIICTAVQITLLFKPLYYFDIGYLNIEEQSGLDRDTITENYDYMINFLMNPVPQEFHLPSLDYSSHGAIHFQDVKRIFTAIYLLIAITGIISAIGLYVNIKKKDFHFLKITATALALFTAIPLIAFVLDFNAAFVFFHEILFTNDYWIFDAASDPVITILPETFFLHAALLILGLIAIGMIILLIAGKKLSKK